MQKRIAVASCCSLIFFAGWAFGQRTLDASNWTDLGRTDGLARLMYVKGYIQGYADGDSAMEKITAVLTKNTPLDSSTKKLIAPQALRLADVVGFEKNVTGGEYRLCSEFLLRRLPQCARMLESSGSVFDLGAQRERCDRPRGRRRAKEWS
jgi:hypothetical protein